MSAAKNATAATALIAHVTSMPSLEPFDRTAVNATIYKWALEQVGLHAQYHALLAEGRHADASRLRADNGGFINGAKTLEAVITTARRMLPEGSAWATHFYAPALTSMVNAASTARVDSALQDRLEYCTDEIMQWAAEQVRRIDHPDAEKVALALGALGGRRAKELLFAREHPMRKIGEHRVAAMLCIKGRRREAVEEEFDTIIPADVYLDAVAFVRGRIPCATLADVTRAEGRMLNRMESTPLLRNFKAAFLAHFKHRQRAGINLMRTLYASKMTQGSEHSLVDTARVLCHRPVRHAARHYDLIKAVEMQPAATAVEPAPRADAGQDCTSSTDENALRVAKRQKTAPALRIEDAASVVAVCVLALTSRSRVAR